MPSKNKNKKAKKNESSSVVPPPPELKILSGDSPESEEAHHQLKRLLTRTLYENKKSDHDTWPQNMAAAEELMSGFVDISCGVPSLMDALPFVVPKAEIKIDAELYEEHSYGEVEEDDQYQAPLCFKQSDSEKLLSLCK